MGWVSMPNVYRVTPSMHGCPTVVMVPICKNCESFVTTDFVRVFGTNDGDVFGCADCMPFRELMMGESAVPNA